MRVNIITLFMNGVSKFSSFYLSNERDDDDDAHAGDQRSSSSSSSSSSPPPPLVQFVFFVPIRFIHSFKQVYVMKKSQRIKFLNTIINK
jgi:hypothetical protein